jgi:signal transduction histidine kinase
MNRETVAGARGEERVLPQDQLILEKLASLGPAGSDVPSVLDRVMEEVRTLVACERGLILLSEDAVDHMLLYVGSSASPTRMSGSEPSIVGRIFETGSGEVVNDLTGDPDTSPLLAESLGARQIVATPLDGDGKRIGVIGAINSRHGSFNREDLIRLSLLAERASLSIQNARLVATIQRQAQELEGLHRMARLIGASESLDYVVEESVRTIADLLECERVALLLHEPETDLLVAHPATIGLTPEQSDRLRVDLAQPSLPATVFRTDAPLTSNSARNDAWVTQDFRDLVDPETLLVVPLTAAGEPQGVLCAIDSRKGGFDDEDTRLGMLLTSRIASVVELSQGRERERALVQRLRELDHTKSEFVSMLAHELKGPMTTVIGFGEVLRTQWQSMDDAKRNHILEIVTRETTRLARLVTDLLDLSRMEAGTLRYEMAAVDLDELLKGILDVHGSLAQSHVISTLIDPHLPAILADPDRLRQVLINLMGNATRYSPEGTSITVSAEPEPDSRQIRIGVADEGIGISEEDRERVFDKFVMLEKPAWVKKGTGLGLFITKGIVEAHGGRLWIESEKGKGSTFFFTIPAAPTA